MESVPEKAKLNDQSKDLVILDDKDRDKEKQGISNAHRYSKVSPFPASILNSALSQVPDSPENLKTPEFSPSGVHFNIAEHPISDELLVHQFSPCGQWIVSLQSGTSTWHVYNTKTWEKHMSQTTGVYNASLFWFPAGIPLVAAVGLKNLQLYSILSKELVFEVQIKDFKDICGGNIEQLDESKNRDSNYLRNLSFVRFGNVISDIPDGLGNQTTFQVANPQYLWFGDQSTHYFVVLTDYDYKSGLENRCFSFKPEGYKEWLTKDKHVIPLDPFKLVIADKTGDQFALFEFEPYFVDWLDENLFTPKKSKEGEPFEVKNPNYPNPVKLVNKTPECFKGLNRYGKDREFDRGDIGPFCNSITFWDKGMNHLVTITPNDPPISAVTTVQIPGKKLNFCFSTLLGGKYLVVNNQGMKNIRFFVRQPNSWTPIANYTNTEAICCPAWNPTTKEILLLTKKTAMTLECELFENSRSYPIFSDERHRENVLEALDEQQLEMQAIYQNHFFWLEAKNTLIFIPLGSQFMLISRDKMPFTKIILESAQNYDDPGEDLSCTKAELTPDQKFIYLACMGDEKGYVLSFSLDDFQLVSLNDKLPSFEIVFGLTPEYLLVVDDDDVFSRIRLKDMQIAPITSINNQSQVMGVEAISKKILLRLGDEDRRTHGNTVMINWEAPFDPVTLGPAEDPSLGVYWATVSKTGRYIAIHSAGSDLVLHDMDSKTQSVLYQHHGLEAITKEMLAFSPDDRFLAIFSKLTGSMLLYSVESMQILLKIKGKSVISHKDRTTFKFSNDMQYLLFSCGDLNQQHIEVYSLSRYELVTTVDTIYGYDTLDFWVDKEFKVLTVLSKLQPERVNREESVKHQLSASLVLTDYCLDLSNIKQLGLMARALEEWSIRSKNVHERKQALDMLFAVWSSVPRHIIPRIGLFPWIVYAMNDSHVLERFFSEVAQLDYAVSFHQFVEVFFSKRQGTDWMRSALQLMKKHYQNKDLPKVLQTKVLDLITTRKSHLLQAELEREMVKLLLFTETSTILSGELESEDNMMFGLSQPGVRPDRDTVAALEKECFSSSAETVQQYRLFAGRIPMDFSNGSDFSLFAMDLVGKVSDTELKTVYRPVVYYKWNNIYQVCFVYSAAFWINAILAYIYLGFLTHVDELGGIILGFTGLLFCLELKGLFSNPRRYFSTLWNIYDLLTLSLAVVAVIYNFSSSEEDRKTRGANVWLRLSTVVTLGIRSITWLRIFAPTRYMITMVLEVFVDIGPFLVILTSIVLLFAYVWRLSANLGSQDPADEINFFMSVIQSVNFIFGNAPDPSDDQATGQYDTIKFLWYIVGNVVLAFVMLNFLIAVISGTYSRVADDSELYDVKELLPLIEDFDLFMKWKRPKSKSQTAIENAGKYYAILLKQDEATTLSAQDHKVGDKHAVDAILAQTTSLQTRQVSLEFKVDTIATELKQLSSALHKFMDKEPAIAVEQKPSK